MPAIKRIEDASFPLDAFPKAEFRRLYAAHPREFFVAEIAGEIVGYVAGTVVGDRGEIESLAVDQRVRRRGIGRLLVDRLVDRFRELGLRTCFLEVRTTNTTAIDLYRRLGFRMAGTLLAYYTDGADAVVMDKALEPGPAGQDRGGSG
jgi:ribosomal-protein-alanine N-acetyltransferase